MFDMYEEQLKLERETIIKAKQKVDSGFISIIEQGTLTDTSFGQNLLRISIKSATDQIKQFFQAQLRGEHRKERERLKLFYEGREDVLAYIILNAMLSLVAKEPMSLFKLSNKLIKHINTLLNIERHKEHDPKLYAYMDYEFKNRGKKFIESRKKKLAKLKGFAVDELEVEKPVKLGTSLIHIIFSSGCNLFQQCGGGYNSKKGQKDEIMIGLSDEAMKLIAKHRDVLVKDVFTYQPLVVPPVRPNSVYKAGGYLELENIHLLKMNTRDLKLLEPGIDLGSEFFDILHNLQQVPYKVNARVLSVMNDIIEDNLIDPSSSEKNPKLYGGIPYMEYIDADSLIHKEDYGKVDDDGMFLEKADFKAWYKAREEQRELVEKIQGRRVGYLYALSTAKKFSQYDRFYYSYQFDYRWRLYPVQQHLNPQMTGNIKALLQFADGQVLTEEGLYWLKIHGANCYGYDKAPYDERIKAIDEREEEIKAIAKDPLQYLERWSNTDSPFEYLAFCFAYADYLADPNTLIHIPVALDATCSGIQIYSGLLRDAEGARAVNVINNDDGSRADIYMEVADVAERLLAEGSYPPELEFGTADGKTKVVTTHLEARSLKGNISRKIVKRPVMTTPYSVTERGMYDQIKELIDEDESNGNIWWKGDKWVVVKLLTSLTQQAISEVVKGATRGQQFIKERTKEITSQDKYLSWNTPIFELPMVQKIMKFKNHRLRTEFGTLLIRKPLDRIHSERMLSSIAPNFIHQLDAMLMFRTVERCMEDGVRNFWLIHDSYGVSPNDAGALSRNVRLSFKELFEQEVLKTWTEQIGLEWDEDIMLNTLDLDEVLDSTYIFS